MPSTPRCGRWPHLTSMLSVVLVSTVPACSAYWPLSEDLEREIRAEATLSPSIAEHDRVVTVASEAARGETDPPGSFALPSEPTLEDYVRLALERNPGIQARVRDLEALGMKVPQVTSLDDPLLGFMPPTGQMTQTAAGEIDASLGLSQKIPFPAKLAARGRVAEQVVRIALENLRLHRLKVIAEVKRAYHDHYLTTISIDVTRENRALLERILEVADAKFRAGTAPQQDVLRAQVELYELSNALLTLEEERRTAVALLNALMDRELEAEIPAPAPFDPEKVDWRLDELLARAVELSPELKALQDEVRRDLEAIRLARLEYFPDLVLGGTYTFIGSGISPVATGKDVWNLTVGLTLPVWVQRLRAGVLERNARALSSALAYRQRRNDVSFAIQQALVRVDTQYRSAILFRDAILPRALQTVEVSESGYQAGQVDFLTWVDNWRRLLGFTLEYHRALASLERSFADLEALVGGGLSRRSGEPESHPRLSTGPGSARSKTVQDHTER